MAFFRPTTKRILASAAAVAMLGTGSVAAVAVVATPAGAQTTTKINPNDFIDPVTGEFDVEAYLAAVAAANASQGAEATTTSGNLPYTGSNTQELALGGVVVLVAGASAVYLATRKRGADDSQPTKVG